MNILSILLGITVLSVLVIIHELGHYLVAKRNGVEVEEFGLGFPPKVWGKIMGRGIMRTYYSFNLLPLGGFVRLKGETTASNEPGSFGAASLWVKSKITYAGVAVNLVAAMLFLGIVAAIKMPVVFDNQFMVATDSEILTDEMQIGLTNFNTPAEDAGLQPGDIVYKIGPYVVDDDASLRYALRQQAGDTVQIEYYDSSENQGVTSALDINSDDEAQQPLKNELGEIVRDSEGQPIKQGYTGSVISRYQEFKATWSAPIVGVVSALQFSWETLALLGDMVTNVFQGEFEAATAGVAGPVGIFYIFSQVDSLSTVLLLSGIISLSLAVMNFLPIPALDGGRMAVTYLYNITNRELTAEKEEAIHGAGMAFLLIIVALITVVDVQRFF